MSVHRSSEPSSAQYLLGALAGALTTLAVSAFVMMALGNADPAVVAHRAGSRYIAYALMLIGGLAGASLTPGVVAAHVARRRRVPQPVAGEQYLPLAVLGGAILGVGALGVVLPAAATVERFVKLLLALTAPAILGASAWLSLCVTIGAVLLFTQQAIVHLDRAIKWSRAAAAEAARSSVDAHDEEHAGARRLSQRFDTVIRVGLGAIVGAGLALRVASHVLQSISMAPGYPFLGGAEAPSYAVARAAMILTTIGGGVLGLRLDRYWRVRARRPMAPIGAWYGHTPVAWLGGVLAAKLLAGLAFSLAGIMFVPMDGMDITRRSAVWLIIAYVFAGLACTFMIGRAVARAIDTAIVRERSHRLPQGERDALGV